MKDSRGFSLVEVMVVTVLMAIISMLSGVLISSLQSMMVGTSRQLMVDEIHAQIVLALSDPSACFQTFGGVTYTGAVRPVPQIIDSFGNVRFVSGGGPYNQIITIQSLTANNFVVGPNANVPAPYNGRFDLVATYRYTMSNGAIRTVSRVATVTTRSNTAWAGGKLAYDPAVAGQTGCSANAGVAFGFDTATGSYMSRRAADTKYGNLTINGNFEVQGITTISSESLTVSDRRLKYDLRPIEINPNILTYIRGYSFKWKSTKLKDTGFIAQEVEDSFPEIVKNGNGKEGYKAINYSSIVPLLAQSSKSLVKKNHLMDIEIGKLEKKLSKMELKKGNM